MRSFVYPLRDFVSNYKAESGIFWKWFIYTVLIGTIGFWMPIIFHLRNEESCVLQKVILSGNVSTFCIVVLAEILGYYEIQKRKDVKVSQAFPALITGLLILNVIVYSITLGVRSKYDVALIGGVSLITILLIIFSFAYRNIDTIADAGEHAKEDDKRVKTVGKDMPKKAKDNPIPPKKN